jgi:hypothetical protein
VAKDQKIWEIEFQKDFPREKEKLHEVAKSRVNPDHWIWKGHVEEIHMHFREVVLWKKSKENKVGKTPEGQSLE